MARPTRKDVDSGLEGWDADMDDNFGAVMDTPFPPASYANTAALPAAALYEGCLAYVVDEDRIYVSSDGHWHPAVTETHFNSTEQDSGMRWGAGEDIVYQKSIDLGALPNSASANTAHGISGIDIVIKFEGAASAAASRFPIPHFATNGIEISMNNTNIIITTTSNLSSYTGVVTVYYTKT